MATKATTPSGLGAKSRKVWRGITDEYDLGPHELRMLEDACREMDLVDRIEKELAAGDLVVEGSQRQPVASPLAQEVRQHRAVIARLFAALRLPEDEGATASRSAAARKLAQQRWRRGA
jgi:hypothetical protein